MSGTDSLIGKTSSHYRILENSAAEAWELFTRQKTLGYIAWLP